MISENASLVTRISAQDDISHVTIVVLASPPTTFDSVDRFVVADLSSVFSIVVTTIIANLAVFRIELRYISEAKRIGLCVQHRLTSHRCMEVVVRVMGYCCLDVAHFNQKSIC